MQKKRKKITSNRDKYYLYKEVTPVGGGFAVAIFDRGRGVALGGRCGGANRRRRNIAKRRHTHPEGTDRIAQALQFAKQHDPANSTHPERLVRRSRAPREIGLSKIG